MHPVLPGFHYHPIVPSRQTGADFLPESSPCLDESVKILPDNLLP